MAEYIKRSYIRKMAMFETTYTMETETDAAAVLSMIEDAPAADVVPVKHGVWEKTGYAYLLRCSVCHDCYIDEDWLDGKKWNFCPHCGAKMNGGDDDETD